MDVSVNRFHHEYLAHSSYKTPAYTDLIICKMLLFTFTYYYIFFKICALVHDIYNWNNRD